MTSPSSIQLTLAILKPHVLKNPIAVQKIRDIILDNLNVVKTRTTTFSAEEAQEFYKEHKGKSFYNKLITFMSSGPSHLHILAGTNAILKWRELLGPTKVYQAQYSAPNSIRAMFGLSDTRNAAHGSDSEKSAEREIGVCFQDFNIKKWYEEEEKYFRLGQLKFDPERFEHTPDKSKSL